MDHQLRKYAIASPLRVVYGGMDMNGKLTTLFDEWGEHFVYRLCEGYLGCAATTAGLLGDMFAEHSRTRAEFLRTAPRQASAATKAGKAAVTDSMALPQITIGPFVQAPRPVHAAVVNHEPVLKL
jgi:hypothetical protein